MRISDTRHVTIVGAGMSGTLLAVLLAQRGFDVTVFEAGEDPRTAAPDPWRSTSLTLGERGRHALQRGGLLDRVETFTTPLAGRMIHDRSCKTTLQPYGIEASETLFSVPRHRLIDCLLDAAESSGKVQLRFGQRLLRIDWPAGSAAFSGARGQEVHAFDVMIGADGPASAVRKSMSQACDLEVSADLLDAGYKPLSIPARPDGSTALDRNALHVWPRGGYMMIALPGDRETFSAILFLPNHGDHRMLWGFEQLDSRVRQRAFMQANFPDATERMPDLEREFRQNRVGKMGTIRCRQWHLGGRALLIGDAAHSVVPFHGQGVNAAFEDCEAVLDAMNATEDWESAFRAVQALRRENTDALASMSLDAYRTIRDSVRHRDFLLRKALERELERRHQDRFMARYALVMFRRLPYVEALDRGRVQAGILDELLEGKHALVQVDLDRAAHLVRDRLDPLPSA